MRNYIKLVLRYKFLILGTYHPDTLFTLARMWGSIVVFGSQKGPGSKKVWETLGYSVTWEIQSNIYSKSTLIFHLTFCIKKLGNVLFCHFCSYKTSTSSISGKATEWWKLLVNWEEITTSISLVCYQLPSMDPAMHQ